MRKKRDERATVNFRLYPSTHRKLLELRVKLYPADLVEIVDQAVTELLERLRAGGSES